MAVDGIEEYLEKRAPADQPAWDPSKIAWSQAEGPSGPYEKSEDLNNLEFKTMLKDIQDHEGKLTRGAYFYWSFQNGHTVGRKRRAKT